MDEQRRCQAHLGGQLEGGALGAFSKFFDYQYGGGIVIQAGIGTIPNAVLAALVNHRDLGVHTELLADGLVALIEAGTPGAADIPHDGGSP